MRGKAQLPGNPGHLSPKLLGVTEAFKTKDAQQVMGSQYHQCPSTNNITHNGREV
jgi:hypothetical protein